MGLHHRDNGAFIFKSLPLLNLLLPHVDTTVAHPIQTLCAAGELREIKDKQMQQNMKIIITFYGFMFDCILSEMNTFSSSLFLYLFLLNVFVIRNMITIVESSLQFNSSIRMNNF